MTDEEPNPLEKALSDLILERVSDERAQDHFFRVSFYAQDHDEVVVALAHDLIEDDFATMAELYDLGITPNQRDAVGFLTRGDEPYEDYIASIVRRVEDEHPAGVLAARVKCYDLFDHLHPHGVHRISPKKVRRYARAIEEIAIALGRAQRGEGGAGDRGEGAGAGEQIAA
jgi:hypothetical protein